MKKLLLITILLTGSLFAQVKGNIEVPYIPYKIKTGEGSSTVQANCLTCHSFGYILNMGKQSKSFWEGKVHKMVHSFKAPIKKKDQVIIANYLFKYYGNGKLK